MRRLLPIETPTKNVKNFVITNRITKFLTKSTYFTLVSHFRLAIIVKTKRLIEYLVKTAKSNCFL